MEKVTLTKGSIKKDFTERAAKIAVESFGWTEYVALAKPVEIGTRTRPPEIKPIQLIQPAEIPAIPKPDPITDLSKETEVKKIEVPEVKKTVRRSPRKK